MRDKRRLLASALLAAVLGSPARGEIHFRTRTDFAVGRSPTGFAFLRDGGAKLLVVADDGLSVYGHDRHGWAFESRATAAANVKGLALGDLNGDGRPDLAYMTRDDAGVSILLGRGGPTFGAPTGIAISSPRAVRYATMQRNGTPAFLVAHAAGVSVVRPGDAGSFTVSAVDSSPHVIDVAVVDLDGNDSLDLALLDEGEERVKLLVAKSDGSFERAATFETTAGPRRMLAADVDADRSDDLLVLGSRALALHLRKEGQRFSAAQTVWAGEHLSGFASADVDGDGGVELAVADRSRGTLTLFHGRRDGSFARAQSYAVGRDPEDVALVDFDGDSVLDLLALNHLGDSVTALRGRGKGIFEGTPCLLSDADDLDAITTADFDRDSNLDLAVTSRESGIVSVFVGDGYGHFAARPAVRVGQQPRGIIADDFDSDRKPDLAVVDFAGDAVAVLGGDGRGGFAAPTLVSVGSGPVAIVSGPFGGPTHADLAVANLLSDSVSVLYGDGRGRFSDVVSFPVVARPRFLLVADIDRDGHADLVVGSDGSEQVSTLRGGEGRLNPPTTSSLGTIAKPSIAEDFDGDGEIDLVVIREAEDAIEILPGTGPGEFGSPLSFPVGRAPHTVAAGDLDADGRVDLAVVHREARIISILLNRTKMRRAPRSAA